MSRTTRSVTAPTKFFIDKGLFNELSEHTKTLGKKPYIIADPFIYQRTVDEVKPSFDESQVAKFGGENSQVEADKHEAAIKVAKADFVIGIGGGKTMDNAKLVAYQLDIPVAILPTLAASDAPATALSVVYTASGEFERYEFLPKNPDIILADLNILAAAPTRTFSAGLADAIATWFEGRTSFAKDGENLAEYRASYAGLGIAKMSYDTVRKYGIQALAAVKNNTVTPAVERAIEASVWMSGVGAEATGLTAAHAIHNGMTAVPDLHGAQHGEKVAFATIATLVLEGASDEEIFDLANFFKEIELPLTLEDMGLTEFKEEEWRQVAEASVSPDDTMGNMTIDVTADDVYQAVIVSNSILQRVKDGNIPSNIQLNRSTY